MHIQGQEVQWQYPSQLGTKSKRDREHQQSTLYTLTWQCQSYRIILRENTTKELQAYNTLISYMNMRWSNPKLDFLGIFPKWQTPPKIPKIIRSPNSCASFIWFKLKSMYMPAGLSKAICGSNRKEGGQKARSNLSLSPPRPRPPQPWPQPPPLLPACNKWGQKWMLRAKLLAMPAKW